MRKSLLLVMVTCWVALPCTHLAAQTTGGIRGTVSDPSGNPLPGVLVEATSVSRGTSRTAVTGVNGRFSLNSLAVDTYSVEATLEGFVNKRYESVRVGIDSAVALDFQLVLESLDETITVTSVPLLEVTRSSVGTNFSTDFIEDLPTNRNFWDMMAVAPGVSQGSENSTSLSALGSSISSNSWSVDGLNATNADTGNAWWYINPETIQEVQVLAIGAPAQYGNMSGAAFNVVTKSGSNEFEGSVGLFLQDDSLTDTNADIDGVEFERDEFRDFNASLGGPLKTDKFWFFAAFQNFRDSFSEPGVDPQFPTSFPSDRYDLKLNAALSERISMDAKYHYEEYDWVYGDAFATPDATSNQFGTNPAWGIGMQAVLNESNFLEARYAGYSGQDDLLSRTRSTDDPFIDYSPADNGPPRFSGSLFFPYLFDLSREQVDVTLTSHADDFLSGDHELKFGISYGEGAGDTITGGGVNGRYFYRYEYTYEYYGYEYSTPYYYRVTARPYHYGADTDTLSAFVDDSWQVNDKLTINVGVRYDRTTSDIPDFPRLNLDWTETGEIIPGQRDAVDWETVSPRLGFALQIGDSSVLRGFYGKFFDANVTGNWYAPPPDAPSYLYEFSTSLDGPWTESFTFEQRGTTVDPDLRPPETDQFTLGYERSFGQTVTVGLQAIHKETKNLIGWEILGDGVYEFVPFVNPLTGEVLQLASIIEQPSRRKGNRPGDGSLAPPGSQYEQDFDGAILTFNKRHSNGWGLMSSYTWSDSNGFLPRPLSQDQGAPFYTGSEGRDPNNWLNANQALQNQREHVVQVQGNFDLPWKLNANVIYRFLSGRPFNRQVRAGGPATNVALNQGAQAVIVRPASNSNLLPDQNVFDLAFGRAFALGGGVSLKIDVQVLNLFNEDAHDFWQTLEVPIGNRFQAAGFLTPRRVMLRTVVRF
ncbi:MAG: TonB-dependent receptor [Acidobacteriota bacterium]